MAYVSYESEPVDEFVCFMLMFCMPVIDPYLRSVAAQFHWLLR